MADMEQVNIRIPAGQKATVMRLARLLRENPTAVHRLSRFLDEQSDPDLGGLLERRIDRLEAQVEALIRQTGGEDLSIPEAPGRNAVTRPVWTAGAGRTRRLTVEGEAELARLIDEGWGDSRIARHLGVTPYSVASRRKNTTR